jgi:hypothetical protein
MATTTLFVELVVIGVGALAWVALTILGLFGYSWLTFDRVTSVTSLVPLLSLTYVLGIVVDRIADRVFEAPSRRLLARWFSSQQDYQHSKDFVYLKSPLRALMEYNRSRLRICRGWAINCIAAVIALNFFVWSQLSSEAPRVKLAVIGSGLLVLFGLGALNAWYQLSIAAYERLFEQAKLLENDNTSTKEVSQQ